MNKQSILLGSSFYDWCLDARLDLGGFSVIAGRRRADCGTLPGRSPDVPFPDITPLERVGIAHRASAYSAKLSLFVRPGKLVAAQLHVLRCGAGYIVPASLGPRIKRTINLA